MVDKLYSDFFHVLTKPDSLPEGGEVSRFVRTWCEFPESDRNYKSMHQVVGALADPRINYRPISKSQIEAVSGRFRAMIELKKSSRGKAVRIGILPLWKNPHIDIGQLAQAYESQEIKISMVLSSSGKLSTYGPDNAPIASISKLFLASSLLGFKDENLNDVATVHDCDLDDRSWGGGIYLKKREFQIRDLVTRSLLGSDNTASNALLSFLKEKYTSNTFNVCKDKGSWKRLKKTKDEYWDIPPIDLQTGRIKTSKNDFHALSRVVESLFQISRANWSPFDDLPTPLNQFIFKGGSSPGVISGAWSENKTQHEPTMLVMSAYSHRTLNLIEEICLTQACRTIFENESRLDLSLPPNALL